LATVLSTYFFHLFTPISIKLTGYVVAKKFGIMEDLPINVVREWKAWCGQPDYFLTPGFMAKPGQWAILKTITSRFTCIGPATTRFPTADQSPLFGIRLKTSSLLTSTK
jgi:hypothetical protein